MIEPEDYILTPCGPLGSRTALSQHEGSSLGEFDTTEDALEFMIGHTSASGFFPNIWWVSDHGNSWQIDTDGNEI